MFVLKSGLFIHVVNGHVMNRKYKQDNVGLTNNHIALSPDLNPFSKPLFYRVVEEGPKLIVRTS